MAMSSVSSAADADRPKLREAVAVFDNLESFQSAIDELLGQGFDRANLGTVADRRTVERLRGRIYDDVAEIEDDASVPRSPFVSRTSLGDFEGMVIAGTVYAFSVVAAIVMAAGGAETTTIVWTVVVAGLIGGALGYLGARSLDRRWTRRVTEQLERGGLVLWVALRSDADEPRVRQILTANGGKHLHVHELPLPDYSTVDRDLDLVRVRHRRPTAWWNP